MLSKIYRRQLSNWMVPALYSAAALTLGLTFPRVESIVFPKLISPLSVSTATAIYSSIASGMLALTGIVFSLSFVMVQFSATAYSPRIVLWIARDAVMSHSLGIFTATFLYAVTALAGIDRNGSGKVPFTSVWIVVVLLLASVAMFISLIQRIGLLQVNRMLIFTGNQGRKVIAHLYPANTGRIRLQSCDHHSLTRTQTLIYNGTPACIQSVDFDSLVELAKNSGGIIEMVASVGDTVVKSSSVLHILGARDLLDEPQLKRAIVFGDERTFEQDPKYAIRLLVDIAIRALSPAVNDPTTAVQALDQIQDLLVRMGTRHLEIGEFHDQAGNLRLIVPFPTWDDLLRLAFDEITFCGSSSVQVMRRMNALFADLMLALPDERRPALLHWGERLKTMIDYGFQDVEARKDARKKDRQGLGVSC